MNLNIRNFGRLQSMLYEDLVSWICKEIREQLVDC